MEKSTVSKSSDQINGKAGNKAKHWTFTIINPNDAHISKFEDIKEFTSYWIYGKEICPTTGTPHLQCYLVGKKQITLPTMRKWFGTNEGNTYLVSHGSPKDNYEYCSKDGKFVEYGTLPEERGKAGGDATKKKWEEIAKNAKEGNLTKICEENPKEFITSYRTLKQIKFDFQVAPQALEAPCGEWIYGDSGVGKSRTARTENPNAYIKAMNKWWDNYEHQDVVIIEDMSPAFGQSMEYFMKIWPDCYPFPAEIKNHITNIRPKKVVVTSQYNPGEIWNGQALEAILRRFKLRHLLWIKNKPMIDLTKKSNPKIKKHDKPFMKEKAPKKYCKGKVVNNTQTQPKITNLKPTSFQDQLEWICSPSKFDPIDDLVDCAEVEACMDGSEDLLATSSSTTTTESYSLNEDESTSSSDLSF